MSIQVFLQGKLLGVRGFLSAGQAGLEPAAQERLLAGKSWWVSLLTEILPRALLAEFGLSKILLGSSGGGQFLLVLPQEFEAQADAFLTKAAAGIDGLSHGKLKLVWASTENLGDWTVVRKRLREAMATRRATLAKPGDASWFAPYDAAADHADQTYFQETLGTGLVEQRVVGWSPDTPERILLNEGKYTWTLGPDHEQILLTRHVALSDDGGSPVTATELGRRADGAPVWGVLRGDVDNLDIRFRRLVSIEEHVQLSVLYKQFFAGELEVLCSMPEFWRKVTILYSGGDDFAAYGSWDALLALARELQRLFRRFSEESLKDFPGGEGKTLTMALALADQPEAGLDTVLQESARMLEEAKCVSRDCFALLGRVLEWRQVNGASELKDTMVRVAQEFGGSTQFLRELAAFYREEVFAPVSTPRRKEGELEKPWRLHRRVLRVLPPTRDRELEKLRSTLMVELVGKNASQVKLRPAGRVALEWARLVTQG
ncbi:MAG: hypothetical protein JNK87_36200 [Bryobacterales bacterium]|nr:hypothetical protein [Bryobacterales bacterium]